MAVPSIAITLDMLNDELFLSAMQRAIDLCVTAERCIEQFERGECPQFGPLKEAADSFRGWFVEPGEDE